ncbi:MAG TPA: glycine cleavage system aminomethyltransferase GcvT [Isosphaeraceae bacterium]|jgi:aminomethyltransferase|nr:glycine cleavage system aminomethyltransferase GcvT [Isosphaeraceae bacterium]
MPADDLWKTALHAWHSAHGGRMVEFGGWSMPVQYSTIVEEHQAVRERVGLFDISHMGRLLFEGTDTQTWLNHVTTNDVARLKAGQIQYSLMTNAAGGVLDDVLIYELSERSDTFSHGMVCNASNRLKVVAQLERHHGSLHAKLADRTLQTAMIAVQGPKALQTASRVFEGPLESVEYYHTTMGKAFGENAAASRTGYTGEDGFEIIVRNELAERTWTALLEAGREFGIKPCGLGARDTLRFEAAMPLYGHELEEGINPYAAGVGWAVKLGKGPFLGREALKALKDNPGQTRVGLALEGKRIARQGSVVQRDGQPIGTVTSGTFAPTLNRSLAMALVDPSAGSPGTRLTIDVRGHEESAVVTALPFYEREKTG